MEEVTIRSIPLGDHQQWLDCTICGPLGVCHQQDVKTTAADHLEGHGVNVAPLRGPI